MLIKNKHDTEEINEMTLANPNDKNPEEQTSKVIEEVPNDSTADVTSEDSDNGIPIDRGWAWMIAFSCFITFFAYFIHDHWHSVLLLDYLVQFDTSVSLLTIMLAMGSICYCISTQVSTNILIVKFSHRRVGVCAAVVNVVASLLLVASNNLPTFFIINLLKYTVKGTTMIPTLTLVGLYFRRRRALAMALGLLGVSASFIVVPPLVRYLRDEYGFRGCILLSAGLEMHAVASALLLRPLDSYKRKHTSANSGTEEIPLLPSQSSETKAEVSPTKITADVIEHLSSTSYIVDDISTVQVPDYKQDNMPTSSAELTSDVADTKSSGHDSISIIPGHNTTNAMPENSDFHLDRPETRSINENASVPKIGVNNHENFESRDSRREFSHNQISTQNNPDISNSSDTDKIRGKSTAYENDRVVESLQKNKKKIKTEPPVEDFVSRSKDGRNEWALATTSLPGSVINLAGVVEPESIETPVKSKGRCLYCAWIRKLIDVDLLKNFISLMLAICYVLNNAGIFTVMYLPSYAITVNVSPQRAAVLLTIFGSTDLVGRVLFGFLADLKLVRPHIIVAAASFSLGLISHFVFLFRNFETLAFFAVVHGLIGGTGQNLQAVMIVNIVGLEQMGKVLAMSSMFLSSSMLIQHPIQGAIIEASKGFTMTYHYIGTSYIMAALLLLAEPLIRRMQERREKTQMLRKMGKEAL